MAKKLYTILILFILSIIFLAPATVAQENSCADPAVWLVTNVDTGESFETTEVAFINGEGEPDVFHMTLDGTFYLSSSREAFNELAYLDYRTGHVNSATYNPDDGLFYTLNGANEGLDVKGHDGEPLHIRVVNECSNGGFGDPDD